ncbi:hypothetical protein BZA70DRAFT_127023 [Myxozyma melibiosi]|uniref:Uncharacterized protein n=1 Tax=Myxozyma melibiosi TaxID=54550 RepID=A0ABR1F8P4_9ASCO
MAPRPTSGYLPFLFAGAGTSEYFAPIEFDEPVESKRLSSAAARPRHSRSKSVQVGISGRAAAAGASARIARDTGSVADAGRSIARPTTPIAHPQRAKIVSGLMTPDSTPKKKSPSTTTTTASTTTVTAKPQNQATTNPHVQQLQKRHTHSHSFSPGEHSVSPLTFAPSATIPMSPASSPPSLPLPASAAGLARQRQPTWLASSSSSTSLTYSRGTGQPLSPTASFAGKQQPLVLHQPSPSINPTKTRPTQSSTSTSASTRQLRHHASQPSLRREQRNVSSSSSMSWSSSRDREGTASSRSSFYSSIAGSGRSKRKMMEAKRAQAEERLNEPPRALPEVQLFSVRSVLTEIGYSMPEFYENALDLAEACESYFHTANHASPRLVLGFRR